jgi:hypothetical protein
MHGFEINTQTSAFFTLESDFHFLIFPLENTSNVLIGRIKLNVNTIPDCMAVYFEKMVTRANSHGIANPALLDISDDEWSISQQESLSTSDAVSIHRSGILSGPWLGRR